MNNIVVIKNFDALFVDLASFVNVIIPLLQIWREIVMPRPRTNITVLISVNLTQPTGHFAYGGFVYFMPGRRDCVGVTVSASTRALTPGRSY